MLTETVEHDFTLNLHVLQTSMALHKVGILGDESVEVFCCGGKSAVCGQESVFLAESAIGRHLVYNIPCHFHGGIGAGAGIQDKKDKGSGGIGGKMSPNAILIIQDGRTKLVNIKQQDTVAKILDMVPDLVERFTSKKDDSMISDEEAKEIAFPEDDVV